VTERRVLLADDESLGREFVQEALERLGYDVHSFADGRTATEALETVRPDLVFSDIRMPGGDGLELLRRSRKLLPRTPVVLLTAFGTVETAVQALRDGAADFLLKPFRLEDLERIVSRLDPPPVFDSVAQGRRGMVGGDVRLVELLEIGRRAAESKATVLVQGESGTGKELVARSIHGTGPRAAFPLVRINCAALAPSLLESELFGHEKGAFTGAVQRRKGRFELAHGGTLLLDEIGELPLELQAKLLRVLEEEEFERVGGSETLAVDVHVIGVTNRELRLEVEEKRFREDLFYRLNVVPLVVPPLRDRAGDIPSLVEHFVAMYWRGSAPAPSIPQRSLDLLHGHHWPGNVRELENLVRRVLVLDREGAFDPELVRELLSCSEEAEAGGQEDGGRTLREMERRAILAALEETGFNRTRAAKILGLSPRTLFNKIRTYEREGWIDERTISR
jgi:DNA-binding NtrC family response regulator